MVKILSLLLDLVVALGEGYPECLFFSLVFSEDLRL